MTTQEISALWNFGDPQASEFRFREALSLTDDSDVRAQLLTQIARAQGLQRDFAAGHATLDQAVALVSPENKRIHAWLAIERGRLHNSSGDPSVAVPAFENALEIAEATGETSLAIDAAHMLGIASPPADQLVWNERALAMAEAATDDRSRNWLGSLLNNIGWTYHGAGDYQTALDRFERAAVWRREKGQATETRIADWAVARTLRSLERIDEALVIQTRLCAEWEAAGESDPYVDEEIAECLFALGRAEEAVSHFAKAYRGLSSDSWLVENEPARISRLRELGRITV